MTDTEASEPRESRPATEAAEPDASAEDSAGSDVERDIDELLEDTQRERDEYLELAKRTRADFENYRRRAAEEVREAERRGKSSLARELIPSLDNLERALRAAGIDPDSDDDGEGNGDGGGLAHGVRLVHREIRLTLERAGVETYDPTGERFDPRWHEALATRAQEGSEAGVVLETVEKGYRLDGQVLRPARVVVSQ
ncbi:MAG TPA: nucleotide exchange factor GrpE [Solirubrobacterales bacterium]|jgi:molecular chaperone GrpE|nr:nucleotide exchange factor GrpE [Solirubrobacterales bacterium]